MPPSACLKVFRSTMAPCWDLITLFHSVNVFIYKNKHILIVVFMFIQPKYNTLIHSGSLETYERVRTDKYCQDKFCRDFQLKCLNKAKFMDAWLLAYSWPTSKNLGFNKVKIGI